MKVYIPEESECQKVTEGLEPAPLSKHFDAVLVPKNPTGPTYNHYVSRQCDGYYYCMISYGGSKYRMHGVDFVCFVALGLLVTSLSLKAWFAQDWQSINPLPSSGYEDHAIVLIFWLAIALFLPLSFWTHKLAKKDAMSIVIFNRETGTVTFPEIENRAGITVPFEEVDYGVEATRTSQGSTICYAYLRTRVCRPGHPPREEPVAVYGLTHDEYVREWNLVCQFMDKTLPIPACLHQVIAANQNCGHDMWEKAPYPEHRIFDPPLHEREFAPEVEATMEELRVVLQEEEGMTESEADAFIEDWKEKQREERRQRKAASGIQ